MVSEIEIATVLINYGIAGVVIYMFYTLILKHLDRVASEMASLREEIKLLRIELSKRNGKQSL